MEKKNLNYDLEDRLVKLACLCLELCDMLPYSKASKNLEYQLSKSGTAPALLYGEAQAAESRADFIHKMKIALKELRETRINIRIISDSNLLTNKKLEELFHEVNELIAIFTKSISTAKRNQ